MRSRILVLVLALLLPAAARGDVIDRILAVVDRELIMLSDVAAAVRFGLVPAPPAGAESVRTALDVLIARQLELGEANRYQPPEPAIAEIESRFAQVRARFGTQSAFDATLQQTGLSADQLRLRLRDDLRIEAYLNQRFGAARQPSDSDLAEYYRTHAAEFTTAAGLRPFAEVREAIRSRLAGLQRTTLMADWLDGLRRRTPIADLYVAEK